MELAPVGVAVVEDPRGEAVRREDDVRRGAAELVGEDANESRVVVPALDHAELRPTGQSRLEQTPVARDRELRVVRREDEPDDPLRAACECLLRGGGDARSQCFIPVKTGSPSSASSAARVSSVMAFRGEPSSTPRRR